MLGFQLATEKVESLEQEGDFVRAAVVRQTIQAWYGEVVSLVAAETGWKLDGESANRRRVVNTKRRHDFEKCIFFGAGTGCG